MAHIRIGISGWSYPGWRGEFYPATLRIRDELQFASRRFPTIEINGTFYRLPRSESFLRWRRETPTGFRFAVKGSRYITHNRKLGGVRPSLARFFASGVLELGEKLGPILWQLPPTLRFDAERGDEFFRLLPHTVAEATRLTSDHSGPGNTLRTAVPDTARHAHRRIRHAIEPRHESFFDEAFARLCRRHGVAIVFSSSADWPGTEEVTAGFVYLRLHGSRETWASRYSDDELDALARRIRAWSRGVQPVDAHRFTDRKPPHRKSRDVYVYFDNDAKVNAPADAVRLAKRLGLHSDRNDEGGAESGDAAQESHGRGAPVGTHYTRSRS